MNEEGLCVGLIKTSLLGVPRDILTSSPFYQFTCKTFTVQAWFGPSAPQFPSPSSSVALMDKDAQRYPSCQQLIHSSLWLPYVAYVYMMQTCNTFRYSVIHSIFSDR